MNIGVDAGALSISDERLKLGVYWVNVNLLRELGRLDTKNTYFLYSFTPIDREVMESFGPRMVNKVLLPAAGWATIRLPLELKFHPVDLFLGLSQFIPPSKAHNIGFIYDLGFLRHPEAYPDSQIKLAQITDNLVDRSNQIITISQAVKDDVVARYSLESKKVTVAYPGVDESFTDKGEPHVGEHPYFLFVGALKPGKNIPFLLQGFAKFLTTQKKTTDLYLGGGEYWKDPKIDADIASLELSSRVKKLGFVPDTKLAQYYRGAVAFVSPSLYEGFCLPAVEAMACGCPVVGSTEGAFPEVVGDGGILVDPYDAKALTAAMETMANDKTKRSSYVKKGLQRAKKYSWKMFASRVYDAIQKHE